MSNAIKTVNNWMLTQTSRQEYGFLKSGRGTVRMSIKYHVEYTSECCVLTHPNNRYNFTNKSEALKYLRIVSNNKLDALQRTNAINHFNGQEIGD